MSEPAEQGAFQLRAKTRGALAGLRTAWWRWLGMQIGPRTYLPRLHVTWPHQVALGADCMLEHGVYFK